MAKSEMARERFKGFVQVSVLDRPYVSKPQERQLLEQGMAQFELDLDEARGILLDAVHSRHIELERDIDRRVLQILERDGGSVKKISRREFAAAAELYITFSRGMLSKEEARLLVKQLMDTNQYRARRGGLTFSRRWYKGISEAKRQGGLLPALLNRQL
jgi:hypothetical protein